MEKNTVIVIGGGLAGLTSAIHLARMGVAVTVIEKHSYPRHKVCGEYISNEVLPYFEWLGLDIPTLNPSSITRTQFSTADGTSVFGNLPLGGFGVSRYTLDHFLYTRALHEGCEFIFENATNVSFTNDEFTVELSAGTKLHSPVVLGAFGKRANIDQKLSRAFLQKRSPWLAVKAHYSGDFDPALVAVHNFNGGYCGVSKVEADKINICYLADYNSFKRYESVADYTKNVVCKNPNLKTIFASSEMLFDKPISISQISFSKKPTVEDHILMIGDSAGLINPLCGNGMAIAIHSAKIASELCLQFLAGAITRDKLESVYAANWNNQFKHRMFAGRLLASMLQKPALSELALKTFTAFPSLLPGVIKQTHGKPIIAGI